MIKCEVCDKSFEDDSFLKTPLTDAFPNQPFYFKSMTWSEKKGNPDNLIFKGNDIPFCGAECSNEYARAKKNT